MLPTEMRFSVVIPTCNRRSFVGRAIESALRQNWPGLEVVVVDDASTDGTDEMVRRAYPAVRFLRQEKNEGPGPARQRGIRAAGNPWVLLLDDDDQLRDGALARVAGDMARWPDASRFPVVQFARNNGSIPENFRVLRLEDYIEQRVRGDFVPLVERARYLAEGLSYPATRLGGEHLLWWTVAERYGLPTWNRRIADVGDDAPRRLTSLQQQLRRAEEHALLQEMTLDAFGDCLEERFPATARKKHLGAAIYWLLAGQPPRASRHVECLAGHGRHLTAAALRVLSFCPGSWLRCGFVAYRMLAPLRPGRAGLQAMRVGERCAS